MPHGLGHKARRDSARSEARIRSRPDSTDPRYWPAPRWTHEMAGEAAAANDRRWATANAAEYLPPPREPITEAWAELEAQRATETLHRLDVAKAREAMHEAMQRAVSAVHGRGAAWPRRESPLAPEAWSTVRAAVRAASRAVQTPVPERGATLPLGPGAHSLPR